MKNLVNNEVLNRVAQVLKTLLLLILGSRPDHRYSRRVDM